MTPDERLQRVTNIVVLMMENRSFDHMLGYLRGTRPEVDGLTGNETNLDSRDEVVRVRPMSAFAGVLEDVLAVQKDPKHTARDVREQLGELKPDHRWSMGGFVKNYEKEHPGDALGAVMGFYEAEHVPTYDFLAREFAICDRWFCSAPSWTWPNRVFAFAGEAEKINGQGELPLFARKSFFRLLDRQQVEWRCYSHDFATLSLVDARYRPPKKAQFRSFEEQFADDCLVGLPPVTWLDPNMMVLTGVNANDDHPPVSIARGQALVRQVYEALCTTPHWATTLFLVVYDEHGGFYDHVPPVPTGDGSPFEWTGVRVPALVVSPLVDRGHVCHETFDHTSIARTIIGRFCPSLLPELTARAQRATHLGHALSANPARPTVAFPGPPMPVALKSTMKGLAGAQDPVQPALSELQRAKITAEFLIDLERQRSPDAPDSPVPALSELERGVIAAEYLSRHIETGTDE